MKNQTKAVLIELIYLVGFVVITGVFCRYIRVQKDYFNIFIGVFFVVFFSALTINHMHTIFLWLVIGKEIKKVEKQTLKEIYEDEISRNILDK